MEGEKKDSKHAHQPNSYLQHIILQCKIRESLPRNLSVSLLLFIPPPPSELLKTPILPNSPHNNSPQSKHYESKLTTSYSPE